MLSSRSHRSALWSAKHSSGSASETEEETAGKKKQAEIPGDAERRRCLRHPLDASARRPAVPHGTPGLRAGEERWSEKY